VSNVKKKNGWTYLIYALIDAYFCMSGNRKMNPSEKSSKNSSQQNSDRQSHSHDEANRRCLKYETAVNQVFYQIQRLRTEMLLLIDSINVHETEDPDSMLLSYQEILKKLRSKLEYHVEEILSSGNSFKMASNNFKSEEDEAATVFDGFCLDKQEISSEDHPNIIYDTRLFNGDVLDGSSTKVSESRSTKGISTCFNCFGAHVLKDCPQPKNRQKIAANLKSFRAKNAQSVTSSRYHLDESNSFKFTPGLLSPELRRAMNLGPSQLPDFVYKMRIIGYPPGWLEDAKIQDDIKLYGGDGNDEVYDTPRSPDLVTYDGSKIVDYPGFNVLPESGVFDDCHRLGYPRLQMSQLKENMPDIKYSK
ncbi:ZCCHC8 (predicted), partial [Pycnogonum litorale]